ncbi:hypothetical protein [Candidatus Electronema sp. JM]|uniref:DUF7507 domain-containing protein n=1 Tax=Candidatus Electronema sp. JM TaxID=3401571 RepID=UPI003AA7DCD5
MKISFRIFAAPFLLGGVLLVSSLVSARENNTCEPETAASTSKEAMDIAICKEAVADDAWAYKVTNTGTVTLTNVRVTDEHLANVNCQQDSLNAGESMACTAKTAESASSGCAVADHIEYSEAGVTVITKGDCVAAIN